MGGFTEFVKLAGGAISAAGQVSQGIAARRAADFNARAAEREAAIAREQALDAQSRGAFAQSQLRQSAAATLASGRVGFAAGNVRLGTGGTPLDFEENLARITAQDAATLDKNTQRESQAFISQSNSLLQEARLSRREGSSTQFGSFLTGTGTLLETAGQVDFNKLFGRRAKPTLGSILNRPGVSRPAGIPGGT